MNYWKPPRFRLISTAQLIWCSCFSVLDSTCNAPSIPANITNRGADQWEANEWSADANVLCRPRSCSINLEMRQGWEKCRDQIWASSFQAHTPDAAVDNERGIGSEVEKLEEEGVKHVFGHLGAMQGLRNMLCNLYRSYGVDINNWDKRLICGKHFLSRVWDTDPSFLSPPLKHKILPLTAGGSRIVPWLGCNQPGLDATHWSLKSGACYLLATSTWGNWSPKAF